MSWFRRNGCRLAADPHRPRAELRTNWVGAAWLRLMHGYGYVEEDIPELSIAVLPSHPGRGMGTTLLNEIIKFAEPIYPSISLSVALENPAAHLYERFGFQIARLDDDLKIMLLRSKNDKTKITK
jgi:ribosomal protein S18 acetylase RimI-like enzyme